MSLAKVEQRPWAGFAVVLAAYAVALVAASVVLQVTPGRELLWRLLAADAVATVVVFVFSAFFNNSSFYDPYWSVAPPIMAGWLMLEAGPEGALSFRAMALAVLLTVYGARLTFNWARGWGGFAHEDWRYVELREKTGKAFWLVSFAGIHFFPTVMVFLGCLPLFPALVTGTAPTNWLDVVATVVLGGAVVLEAVADEQMRAFRQEKGSGAVCEVGLWRYSRHPNYLGEILVWVGLFLFGLAAGGPAWHGVGALAMWAMFYFITIPMAEQRSLKRRPDFAKHQAEVSMLIPMPRRTPASPA